MNKFKEQLLSNKELKFISELVTDDKVTIYTDGSCLVNDSKHPSTHGFVIIENDDVIFENSGKYNIGTNNISELTALIQAVQVLIYLVEELGTDVVIYSDSQYSINTLFNWSPKWIASGKTKKKKNMELVMLFHGLNDPLLYKDNVRWVKGHSDNIWNDYVDNLCRLAY